MSQQPSTASPTTAPNRYWIRNEVGRVWGPFSLESVGRINVGKDNIARVMVSTDGATFASVTQFPAVQEALERGAKPLPIRTPQPLEPASRPPQPRERLAATPPPPPPPPPPTEAVVVGVPKEGDLKTCSVARLYAQIGGEQLTGKIQIQAADGQYGLSFKKGTPERVDVPRPAETLARFLQQRGVASAGDIQNAVEISGGPEGELVDALFALSVVPQHELFPLLGEHGTEMLFRVLSLDAGTFTWEAGKAPPPGSFPLGQKWDLLCRWVRKVPRLVVRERLGERASQAAYRSSGAFVTLEALKLTAQETRVASAFDGRHSPEQIAFEHMGEQEVVYRTALLLAEVGFVSFGPVLRRTTDSSEIDQPILERVSAGDERSADGAGSNAAAVGRVGVRPAAIRAEVVEPAKPAPPVAAAQKPAPAAVAPKAPPVAGTPKPPPVAAAPKAPPAPPPKVTTAKVVTSKVTTSKVTTSKVTTSKTAKQLVGDDVDQLLALLEKWKTADHFDVLGVPQTAGPADIKAAYITLARQYHPDTVTGADQEALRQVKADLVARVNEAYQLLSDTQARTKYIAEIQSGGQVDIGPILQAEEDFLRATILVKARKFQEALDLLERAIAMNQNEREFLAWRAWSRFCAAKDKKEVYEESMSTCTQVIKEMPQCVAAHLFVGQMAKIMGDLPKAEKAFRVVVELDPNNVDAKRELRGKI